ncbi:hypothetical protein CCR85_11010 [Rhodothalassium salexigens]|uniref:hypothetical protein n=1 Tax=Rhodothalassium salexigens TaxID=1086 RepID=UPI0019130399|nr:hypothetical protein [Rhodothalassium salexigens]MBK5912018.1 hypothetical protein [Rhodothalassium salexigens]
MPTIFALRRLLLLSILTAVLAGCGANRNPLEVTVQRCPAVAFVDETANWVEFAGEDLTAEQVVFDAMLSNLDLTCTQDTQVESVVSFDVSVRGGPALDRPVEVTLPYYVVLLRDNSVIAAKKTYEVTFVLDPEAPRAGSRETVRQVIDDIERTRRYDYELLIGFQMDPEAVAYNELR